MGIAREQGGRDEDRRMVVVASHRRVERIRWFS
jgi:hypothetical protein